MYKTKVLFLQHHFQDCILEHLFPFPHAAPLVFNLATVISYIMWQLKKGFKKTSLLWGRQNKLTCYHLQIPLHTPWRFRPFITWPQCTFYSSLVTPLTVHFSQIVTHPTFFCFCSQFYSLQLKSFLSSIKPYRNSTHVSRTVSSFI